MQNGKEEKAYRVGWLDPMQPRRWCYTVTGNTGKNGGPKVIEGEELF